MVPSSWPSFLRQKLSPALLFPCPSQTKPTHPVPCTYSLEGQTRLIAPSPWPWRVHKAWQQETWRQLNQRRKGNLLSLWEEGERRMDLGWISAVFVMSLSQAPCCWSLFVCIRTTLNWLCRDNGCRSGGQDHRVLSGPIRTPSHREPRSPGWRKRLAPGRDKDQSWVGWER